MDKRPETPSRDDLLNALHDLKARISRQDDELRGLRTELEGLTLQVESTPSDPPLPLSPTPTPTPTPVSPAIEEVNELPEQVPAKPVAPPPLPLIVPIPQPPPEPTPVVAQFETPPAPIPAPAPEPAPLIDDTPANRRMDLETRIGAYWFNRIGLLSMVVAFALFTRYIHSFLQPPHKVLMLYLGSGLLFGLGKLFEKKLQQFARPVMAGGLALAFLTSYAAHFVPATACLSLTTALILMLVSAGAMLACAERWRSEPTAALALLLGHAAVFIAGQDSGTFTVVAILMLSAIAFVLGLRHQWMPLNLVAVFAAFISHAVWALRQPDTYGFNDASFWIHLLSLTAYYILFTAAAVLFQRRQFDRGADAFTARQRFAGRAVGPAAMIFYASLAAVVFRSAPEYRDAMHFFLFPLALVQWLIARFHQKHQSRDTQVYVAAGVVFFTLGLFAAFDGLTLNLALAAQALLLLILARSMNFWVLNPLAQVVLGINFVHFWVSDASTLASWPAYIGAVATASVYFVKSRLEETWQITPGDADALPSPAWVTALRDLFARLVKPLSHLHAAAGAILLSYQCTTFFDYPQDAIALTTFVLILYAVIAIIPCRPWLWAIGILHLTLIDRFAASGASWITYQYLLWLLVGGAFALLVLARKRGNRLHNLTGILGLALGAPLVYFATSIGHPTLPLATLGLLAPLAYWIAVEFLGLPSCTRPQKPLPPEKPNTKNPPLLRHAFAIVAAGLTYIVIHATFTVPIDARWLLPSLTWLILAAVIFRGSAPLATGLVTYLFLTLGTLFDLNTFLVLNLPPRFIWFTIAGAIGSAAALCLSGVYQRRTSFLYAGLLSLAGGMTAIAPLVVTEDYPFPLALWLLTAVGFWIAIESFNLGLRKLLATDTEWADESGLRVLSITRSFLASLFSIAGAGLLVFFFAHAADSLFGFWRAETIAIIVFLVGTAALRSPSLATAGAICFVAAHVTQLVGSTGLEEFLFENAESSFDHPVWTWILIALSLAAGTAAEWLYRRRKGLWSVPARTWLFLGTWYGALTTQLLGAIFFFDQADTWFEADTLSFPCMLIIALLVCQLGSRLRLSWTAISVTALAAFCSVGVFLIPNHLTQLHVAAIFIAAQLIALERMLSTLHTDDEEPRPLFVLLRRLYVLGGAVLLMLAFHLSPEIRDTWTTLGWSITALVYLGLGFLVRFSAYRRVGLVMFIACIIRILAVDMAGLDPLYRMIAFLALGICLVGASFLYTRYREEITKWL